MFMLSGPFFLQIINGHLSNLCAMTWTPLIFLALEGWNQNPNRRWLALGVLAVSMQILAGHPQYVFYTFLAVLAYERASVARTRKPIRWRIRTARHEHGLEPEKIPTDIVAGHRVERLTIERIA